jgi:phosphoribosylanthranilate isomerase
MKIKVCGITRKEDLDALVQLGADYAGFIFYGKSPRFVGSRLDGRTVRETGRNIAKVGVFVNAAPQQVLQTVKDYGLDLVQLHGEESVAVCEELRLSIPVIKAFPMGAKGGTEDAEPFAAVTDYFLFDTAGKEYGGTGKQFDWERLNGYQGETPFFLSGGIGPEDAEAVLRWRHDRLFSLDVNSRFETAPGIKDMDKVAAFIKTIKK